MVSSAVIVITIAVIYIIIRVLARGYEEKCPKCGKLFAMKEIEREHVSSYSTTIDVEQEIKDKDGKKSGSYTQAVPATTYVYNCIEQCKYYQFKRTVQKKETYRD